TITTMRFALGARRIDGEHIYAALSAYLLAGLFFGVLHWVIATAWPGSFGGVVDDSEAGFTLATAIYFSFVTLATLGSGDVIPKPAVARGVAILEAVGGQLFIAVLVARLVSAQLKTPGGDVQR